MKKLDWERELRRALVQVPLPERRDWKDPDLMAWYYAFLEQKPGLRWDKGHGDLWAEAQGACRRYIGPGACV